MSQTLPSLLLTLCNYSEYGFAEKVVEGMSVRINSITIKVQARAFHASFELWQLQGNSLNPKWQRSDLRYTRVTDPKRGEVRSTFIPLLTKLLHCSFWKLWQCPSEYSVLLQEQWVLIRPVANTVIMLTFNVFY